MNPNFLTSVQDNILTPVEDHILSHNKIISSSILGNKIKVHTKENGLPNIRLLLDNLNDDQYNLYYFGKNNNEKSQGNINSLRDCKKKYQKKSNKI